MDEKLAKIIIEIQDIVTVRDMVIMAQKLEIEKLKAENEQLRENQCKCNR